jgi:hypothetical protein
LSARIARPRRATVRSQARDACLSTRRAGRLCGCSLRSARS